MKPQMMNFCRFAALSLVFASISAVAQAPAGATGRCKDGTYSTAAKKSGACSGHKGVDTWYAASGNQPTAPSPSAPATPNTSSTAGAKTATPAPSPKASSSPAVGKPQAAGGGPGMVWVNTSSKVYHCPGTEYYGKTKQGKYLSESDAVAMGARPDHGKACSK